ncbi:divalent-cation tolerance protein CutA [Methanofollis fontis]|uniref:Divalent-cation tolerance protein CutA n=1 Tax=Methanofollis fontis TaxID=2052832 RepID=A0A483CMM5_9EURY|nr:divalent-cation tolerance protein CutA [Methanofollis fontis]TAJ43862.1 divalent-cation tolerance protein CutA [Methanofollis fontis]
MEGESVVIVLCTAPSGDAERIADLAVRKHDAACVNIVGVGSVFRWEGEVQRDREELMIFKTTQGRLSILMDTIQGAHPYEVPEIIAVPVIEGAKEYLAWVAEMVKPPERH